MIGGRIAAGSVLALVAVTAAGSRPATKQVPMPGAATCYAASPAIVTARPPRWLGACPHGMADGIGVLRFGATEPYQFFFGEMHAGRPVHGMLKLANGWHPAAAFDGTLAISNPRSWNPDDAHAINVLAARAASVTAQRFSVAGNRGSAAYYERFAKQITDSEPE